MYPNYERFEVLLRERGITAYRVSAETGIPTSTLTNWKHGRYNPKINKIKLLAEYFNVPIEYFLNDNEPEE